MADFISKHETSFTNAQINASSSENFLSSENNRAQTTKNGQSFNFLEIVNASSNTIQIDLDGLSTRRRVLFGNAALVILPEEEIFFNTVKITNASASTAISASAITGIARIMKRVLTPVVGVGNARV